MIAPGETVTISRLALTETLEKQFAHIQRLARDSRLRYAVVVYGVEDRGTVSDYLTSVNHTGLMTAVGRVLLKVAMRFLGGQQQVVALAPAVALEPAPKSSTVH